MGVVVLASAVVAFRRFVVFIVIKFFLLLLHTFQLIWHTNMYALPHLIFVEIITCVYICVCVCML